ncbi:MAG: type IV pilus twitching motility protein PilT [Myxococcaceae bacterium]|nr:type IV pilus twitching motility protein PilT [Myxococcaceae bacterium]
MDATTMNKLLSYGVQNGASDIHFRPGDPPTFRVAGVLRPVKGDKLGPTHTRQVAQNVISNPAVQSQVDTLQEYDTSYTLAGVARFRVNVYRQRGSLAVVLRVIPTEVPTLESLKLPAILKTIASNERGLVLVTGSTGAGKSTTLAAMVDHINRNDSVHILTIEDPIEFMHRNIRSSISQREIGYDTADFGAAMRSALRQDPDVILVGEMRDHETVDIALKAAETGHLVLSTVHTTDAIKTISRLLSFFPGDEQQAVRGRLSEALKATVSQRLLPKADGQGMTLGMEIMIQTKTISEYILDASRTGGLKDVIEKGRTYGMQSFDQHLSELFKAGAISMETARASASNPADFERNLAFE